ncbi:MAG: FtsX-like permease family protein [Phycisphaerae bacterium]
MPLPLYYNWRNLWARKLSTALTFCVVCAVVLTLAVLLSFSSGLLMSLQSTGSPANVMVLKPGATAESTSLILPDEVGRVIQAPGIERTRDGVSLISPELCVQTTLERLGPQGKRANVAVRGVDDVAFAVHTDVRIARGRVFTQGAPEAIVGKKALERYQNLSIDSQIEIGRAGERAYRIVGVFEAGGGALESEIWTPRTMLADTYQRDPPTSSVVVRAENAAAVPEMVKYLTGPAVQLQAKRETDYYGELSEKTGQIVLLATALVAIMAIGAVFAVANTMYASVDSRRREIAMLRTLGFSRREVVLAFILESLMLCGLASAAGLALSLLTTGARTDFLSDTTWTVLAYESRLTPGVIIAALGLALLVSVFGSLAPALRASRIQIIEALRKA